MDKEIIINGSTFNIGCDGFYYPDDVVKDTWFNIVNSDKYKGMCSIIQIDANPDTCDIKTTIVEIVNIIESSKYDEAKKWAEIYEDEDKKKYYAVMNMCY